MAEIDEHLLKIIKEMIPNYEAHENVLFDQSAGTDVWNVSLDTYKKEVPVA